MANPQRPIYVKLLLVVKKGIITAGSFISKAGKYSSTIGAISKFVTKPQKNPLMLFVYGIISQWILLVTITALIVTYWVFDGLSQAGVLQNIEKTVTRAFNEVKIATIHCTPQILNLADYWHCLDHPSLYGTEYLPTPEEKMLIDNSKTNQVNPLLGGYDIDGTEFKNPYEE